MNTWILIFQIINENKNKQSKLKKTSVSHTVLNVHFVYAFPHIWIDDSASTHNRNVLYINGNTQKIKHEKKRVR